MACHGTAQPAFSCGLWAARDLLPDNSAGSCAPSWLVLAVQIEEHYISAAELGRLTGAPAEVILRTELTALQVR